MEYNDVRSDKIYYKDEKKWRKKNEDDGIRTRVLTIASWSP